VDNTVSTSVKNSNETCEKDFFVCVKKEHKCGVLNM
jgi:hypothetical protein